MFHVFRAARNYPCVPPAHLSRYETFVALVEGPLSHALLSRKRIAEAHRLIRSCIRRTPLIEADGADFGLDSIDAVFKLESLQHSGSFKARGAFANLLMREVPSAGVAAASGGNHGAAVAFAALKLGKAARIFVPSVASPAKIERIHG